MKNNLGSLKYKKELFQKEWDYSIQAKYYNYRPNYPEKAIKVLAAYIGAKKNNFSIVDIGAGTGNLTILLLRNASQIIAIEPNDRMRNLGIQRTKRFKNIKWIKASGIHTTLKSRSANWVTFGSSFNVMDRKLALQEAYRLLKTNCFFTCLWNHRNLDDPIQNKVEDIILNFIPDYKRGVRREDQKKIIEASKNLFKDIFYLEMEFEIERTIDEYIYAWMSVKNKYWDLSTVRGQTLFNNITNEIRKVLPNKFKIKYTTKAWTAQKAN